MVESTTTHYFQVAGLKFAVELPCTLAAGQLLPSFAPFKADAVGGDCLFSLSVADGDTKPADLTLIEESDNDMGHLRLFASPAGYRVEIVNDGCTHSMNADKLFSRIEACLDHADRLAGNALSSMLRIAFAQAALRFDAVSIHASAVACDGRACLFMGKSGTGKSTHSALWLRHIPGTELLNDDNPAIHGAERHRATKTSPCPSPEWRGCGRLQPTTFTAWRVPTLSWRYIRDARSSCKIRTYAIYYTTR